MPKLPPPMCNASATITMANIHHGALACSWEIETGVMRLSPCHSHRFAAAAEPHGEGKQAHGNCDADPQSRRRDELNRIGRRQLEPGLVLADSGKRLAETTEETIVDQAGSIRRVERNLLEHRERDR